MKRLFHAAFVSNEEGEVVMEFSMPEALTKWKFMGFTHDNELRSGVLSGSTVTAKDIWCSPTRRASCARATNSSSRSK